MTSWRGRSSSAARYHGYSLP